MSSSSLQALSPEAQALKETLEKFVTNECIPAEAEFEEHLHARAGSDRWTMGAIPDCIHRLKLRAQELGLWNLFIPPSLVSKIPWPELKPRVVLSYREYGVLCEIMGRSFTCPEACNCSAPDTGNMEVLLHFGTPTQKELYLKPLLEGKIRSAFLMTEPDVASSDATNMQTRLQKQIDNKGNISYLLNGKKWWSTGAMDPRCAVALVVCKMDYSRASCTKEHQPNTTSRRHGSHTVVLVDMTHPGVNLVRPLTCFGYDDAPSGHAEVHLKNIQLSSASLIIGEGSGFRVAQARLGPGRIHHCMRSVGLASRCYELMLERSLVRSTFGKPLWQHGACHQQIADSYSDLEAARLLTLNCAAAMDQEGPRKARQQIASIKVTVPLLTSRVVDRAVQIFGGAGVSGDFPLARALVGLRSLRIADGPDDVHRRTVALLEIKRAKKRLKENEASSVARTSRL